MVILCLLIDMRDVALLHHLLELFGISYLMFIIHIIVRGIKIWIKRFKTPHQQYITVVRDILAVRRFQLFGQLVEIGPRIRLSWITNQ